MLAAGLAEPRDVVVVAASGTSGAGRSASAHLLGSEVMGSLSAYKAGGAHQHTPEMAQTLSAAAGRPVTVSFTPVLAPMPRGILATTSAPAAPGVTTEAVRAALHDAYDDERVRAPAARGGRGRGPRTCWAATRSTCRWRSTRSPAASSWCRAIDNLVKGAAGQAVQNANLALGLDGGAGLSVEGVAP